MKYEYDYRRGQRDCKAGVPHKPGQSEFYDRGYGNQYAREQVATVLGGAL